MKFLTAFAFTVIAVSSPVQAKTIGVAMTNTSDKFLGTLLKSIQQAAGKAASVELRVEDARGDPAKQIDQIRKMINDKVDALIVTLSDGDLGTSVSKIGAEAGVPVVYVNNVPVNFDELPPYQTVVASNELESGTMQAKEVCKLLGGKGTAVVLVGEYFSPGARLRTKDVDDVMASPDCKGINIVERQSANWSRDQANSLTREWLAAGIKFDAVIANNDEMALGAVDVLKEKGLSMTKIVVAGVDATDDALAAMVAGDLDVTVLQSAPEQGAKSVEAALKMIKGEAVSSYINIPFELVTPTNIQKYLPKSQ